MYIIYLILSLLGIQAPYSSNGNKHGEEYHSNSTQIASDILKQAHAASESICLSGNTQLCLNGMVQQNTQQSTANQYGNGVISVSDGKDNVVTFMPKSNSYRFDASKIGGDIYDNLNKHLGTGVNSGYYDARLNEIVLKRMNGTTNTIPLPSNMNSYQLYDHMPVLTTSLKDSSLSLSSNTTTTKQEDVGSMRSLKTDLITSNAGFINGEGSASCADGSSGGSMASSILCGSVQKDVPSTTNNQTGGTANGNGIGGVGASSSGTDYPQENGSDADNANGTGTPINVNYSSNGTMYMGAGNTSGDDSDNDGDSISLNQGQQVPLTSNNINNCQNILFPSADSTKSGANNLGYSYTYDYYIDLGSCNAYVRPSLDIAVNNYAVLIDDDDDIADVSNVSLGWGYKLNDYVYYDWFGADDDGVGVRNPNSPTWNTNRNDCTNGIGTDIYNASYLDLEAMATQDPVTGSSSNLNACQDYGGANGSSLGDVNSDITYVFSKVDGNIGPYLNSPFSYWGVSWTCYPDAQDRNSNVLHYHVTCVPNIPLNQQTNDYAQYSIWSQFSGQSRTPLGGLFSIGHKGSNNLGGTWPSIDDSSSDDNNESDDNSTPQSGLSGTGDGHYQGQAIGSYSPFLIQGRDHSDKIDGVSLTMSGTIARRCSASNPANATGIVPSGRCNTLMNGILVARNKSFFNFEESLLQSFSQIMSQNGWASATSTLDGSVLNGTAGYPVQESDGTWRWHLAPIVASSFPTPNGNLVTNSTNSSNVHVGDYFSYTGVVQAGSNLNNVNSVNNISNVNVPSYIGYNANGNVGSNGGGSSNGYNYNCALGQFLSSDKNGNLTYNVDCTINSIPYVPQYVSNGAPWGNIITTSTNSSNVHVGDYFKYTGSVPLSIATGKSPASNEFITPVDTSSIPGYIGWGNPNLVPGNSFSSNGYAYTCNLGEHLGDYGSTPSGYYGVNEYSLYNIYCKTTAVPYIPQYISNGPPSGNLITVNTQSNNVNVGDYFVYNGSVPLSIATGKNPSGGESISAINSYNVPNYIGWNGQNILPGNWFSSNGYGYSCNLGERLGNYGGTPSSYYGVNEYSSYNIYCQITQRPAVSQGPVTTESFGIPDYSTYQWNNVYQISGNIDKHNIKYFNYFIITVKVPNNINSVYYGDTFNVIDTSQVPYAIGFNNGFIYGGKNIDNNSDGNATIINGINEYNYLCNLHNYQGYDPNDNMLIYSADCGIESDWEDDHNKCSITYPVGPDDPDATNVCTYECDTGVSDGCEEE